MAVSAPPTTSTESSGTEKETSPCSDISDSSDSSDDEYRVSGHAAIARAGGASKPATRSSVSSGTAVAASSHPSGSGKGKRSVRDLHDSSDESGSSGDGDDRAHTGGGGGQWVDAEAQAAAKVAGPAVSASQHDAVPNEECAKKQRSHGVEELRGIYQEDTHYFVQHGSSLLKKMYKTSFQDSEQVLNLGQYVKEGHNSLLYMNRCHDKGHVPSAKSLESPENTLIRVHKANNTLKAITGAAADPAPSTTHRRQLFRPDPEQASAACVICMTAAATATILLQAPDRPLPFHPPRHRRCQRQLIRPYPEKTSTGAAAAPASSPTQTVPALALPAEAVSAPVPPMTQALPAPALSAGVAAAAARTAANIKEEPVPIPEKIS